MSILSISVMDKGGVNAPIEIQPSAAAPWKLTVYGNGFSGTDFLGNDLFGALMELRRELEQHGVKLLCAGARRDVYPSGMSRSMGNARKAYIIKHGQPATETVDIFDYADPSEVGSINEQRIHWEQWMASLKNKLVS